MTSKGSFSAVVQIGRQDMTFAVAYKFEAVIDRAKLEFSRTVVNQLDQILQKAWNSRSISVAVDVQFRK